MAEKIMGFENCPPLQLYPAPMWQHPNWPWVYDINTDEFFHATTKKRRTHAEMMAATDG